MRVGFKRFLFAFFAVFFVVFGIALLCLELQNFAKAKASTSWSSTDGIVVHTDYERTSVGRRTSNAPYVTYRYQVRGRSYTSNVLSFGDDFTAADIFQQYPTGRIVTVYYNPKSPSEATLVKGIGTSTIVGLHYAKFLVGLSIAFLAYVLFTELRRFRSSQQTTTADGGG